MALGMELPGLALGRQTLHHRATHPTLISFRHSDYHHGHNDYDQLYLTINSAGKPPHTGVPSRQYYVSASLFRPSLHSSKLRLILLALPLLGESGGSSELTNEFPNCKVLCSLEIISFLSTRSPCITLADLELAMETCWPVSNPQRSSCLSL